MNPAAGVAATDLHPLADLYLAPSELTLEKLRQILESLAALIASEGERAPRMSSVHSALADVGADHLPLAVVEMLARVAFHANGRDVLGHLSLKQLEGIMARIR